MLYTYIAVGLASAAIASTLTWNVQQWRFDSKTLAAEINQRATERLRRQNSNTAAIIHEKDKTKIRTEFETIIERVDREIEVEKVVYRNICITNDGLRELTNAARATGYTGQPSHPMPAASASK